MKYTNWTQSYCPSGTDVPSLVHTQIFNGTQITNILIEGHPAPKSSHGHQKKIAKLLRKTGR